MTWDDGSRWAAKRQWHEQQRKLSPAAKIKLIMQLQLRESFLDRTRVAAGQRPRGLKPWRTHA